MPKAFSSFLALILIAPIVTASDTQPTAPSLNDQAKTPPPVAIDSDTVESSQVERVPVAEWRERQASSLFMANDPFGYLEASAEGGLAGVAHCVVDCGDYMMSCSGDYCSAGPGMCHVKDDGEWYLWFC